MFQVQRAGTGRDVVWKTVCLNASEAYAREVYQKQLKLHSAGRFRLIDANGKVLAEAKARPLFDRDDDEEQRQPTYYAPPPATSAPG